MHVLPGLDLTIRYACMHAFCRRVIIIIIPECKKFTQESWILAYLAMHMHVVYVACRAFDKLSCTTCSIRYTSIVSPFMQIIRFYTPVIVISCSQLVHLMQICTCLIVLLISSRICCTTDTTIWEIYCPHFGTPVYWSLRLRLFSLFLHKKINSKNKIIDWYS